VLCYPDRLLQVATGEDERKMIDKVTLSQGELGDMEMSASIRSQYEDLVMGTVDALPAGGLEEQLVHAEKEGRSLRVKLGVDPTSPDIHLGHSVVLRKLATFQKYGHQAVLIIGDYTAKVGDPSGRSKLRPRLSDEEIAANASTYMAQAAKVLDMERVELVRNGDWLSPLGMDEVLRLTAVTTVARMLERDDFHNRYKKNEPISMLEFMYPLLQGYDSVAIRADVELGGTDQKFNLLMGRSIMSEYGQTPQSILTVPLLEGTDGVQKMSKSYGNYVGIAEPAEEMFGKLMSVPDHLIIPYWTLLTDAEPEELETVQEGLTAGDYHPATAKRDLAERIVSLYHSRGAAQGARREFDNVFKERQEPSEIPESVLPPEAIRGDSVWLPRLLSCLELTASNGEARRLMQQGAVRVGEHVVKDPDTEYAPGELEGVLIRVGKRRFTRIAAG